MVRKRYSSTMFKLIASGINAGVALLIPYIFGLMNNLDIKHELVFVWACFLLYVYNNVPSTLALNDSLSAGVGIVRIILYTYYITALYSRIKNYLYFLYFVLLYWVSLLKVLENASVRAFMAGDKTALMKRKWGPNNDLQDVDDDLVHPISDDPLLRCNYIVHKRLSLSSVLNRGLTSNSHETPSNNRRAQESREFTIQQIWGSYKEEAGCMLSSSRDPSNNLKSCCLSFSMFWKLKNKIASLPTYESSHQEEAWNLVRNGLLDPKFSENRCPFRVIEVELAFLYDFIYNSICYSFYLVGWPWILARQFFFLGAVSLAVELTVKNLGQQTTRIQYHKHDMDILLTWFVIVVSIVLELVQLITCLSSRWSKMRLLCTYLNQESWKKKNLSDRCIRKAAEIILCPMSGGELFKPWQRKLRQYSLLHSYSYKQQLVIKAFMVVINFLTGNRFVRQGRKESQSASLTDEIKKAVIQTLLDRGRQLTSGIATLEAADYLPEETKRKLASVCTQFNTDAEVVLVWHIATSLCEISPDKQRLNGRECTDFRVATTLSKYCAYLAAFAPHMLPGFAPETDRSCSSVIEDAHSCLQNCDPSSLYGELMKIADGDSGDSGDQNSERYVDIILKQGAVLGKVLDTEIVDPTIRWKVLAQMWAEMILYLSPNTHNEWAHVEKLADGGEFITHLWALLFHAGIVDRDSLSNKTKD